MTARLFGLGDWPSRLTMVGLVVGAAILALWILNAVVPRLLTRVRGSGSATSRQRQTAAGLLASALRYVIVVAALAASFVALAGGGTLGAVSGAAIVLVVVSFASQRLLGDVIAGFFVLLEGQYAVGDVVRVEPSGIAGVVEELGLRATVIRDPNGDLCHVPNGQITAVRRAPTGGRVLRVTLVTRDPNDLTAAVEHAVAAVAHARLSSIQRRDAGAGVWVLTAAVTTPSAFDRAVEHELLAAITARGDGLLLGAPTIIGLPPSGASATGGVES